MIFQQTKFLRFIFLCLLFWISESYNFTSVCFAQSDMENETKVDTVSIATDFLMLLSTLIHAT